MDLDGDGRLDLVSGGADGTFLAWQNNAPPAPTPASASIAVTVTAENDAPAVTSGATANYAENGTGTAYQATATDPDGTTSFTWSLSGADAARFDISSTGAVTFKAAPDFEAPADAGADNVYDIVVQANDGALNGTQAVTITVTDVSETPKAISGFGPTASFNENTLNAAPQLLDADVVFTQAASLAGGTLVVGGLLAEDRVSVLTQGNAAGQIGFDGTTVSYGGVAIGTATGGLGADFTITFNASVTSPAVDALIQRLSYANVSDTPTTTRTLTLDVTAASGTASFAALTGSANPFNGFDVGVFSAPSFVDLDGDSDLDLVSGENTGTFLAWKNTASGFTALTGSANPFNGFDVGTVSTPSFVDLDGDGRLDLVSGEVNGTFLVWQNTGSGFTALTGTANPFNGLDVGMGSAPSFVDLDGDGMLDLVSGAADGTFLVWKNTGTAAVPVFTALTGSANPLNGCDVGTYSAPSFVDLDGDSDLDLVSGENTGTFKAWQNTGSGFTALTGTANPFNGFDVGTFSAPSFVDLEGDGDLDLVSGGADGIFSVWKNNAPPASTPASASASIAVTVTAENDAPAVTSGATANYAENGTGTAYQATATDPDGTTSFTWSLSGTDAALFDISSTGAVTFKAAPNFEAPADGGGNNIYDINVIAFDGGLSSPAKAVAITVTDVTESAGGTTFISVDGQSGGRAWIDVNQNGLLDGTEAALTLNASRSFAGFAAGSSPTFTMAGINFATDDVTIKFWQMDGPTLDLRGFSSDDSVILDLAGMSDWFGAQAGSQGYNQPQTINDLFNNNAVGVAKELKYGYPSPQTTVNVIADWGELAGGRGMGVLKLRSGSTVSSATLGIWGFSAADTATIVTAGQVQITWPSVSPLG